MVEAPRNPIEQLLLVGTSRRRVPLSSGEALFGSRFHIHAVLKELSDGLIADGRVGEVLVLQTRERIEFLVVRREKRGAVEGLLHLLAKICAIDAKDIAPLTYTLEGEAALHHLFEVAASLDSEGFGGVGQLERLRRRFEEAKAFGTTGEVLNGLVPAALSTGKRILSETEIDTFPQSLGDVALDVARSLHGDLAGCRGLLVGLGETAELLADEFQRAGVEKWVVLHPSARRAEAFARRIGGHFRNWEDLDESLEAAEIVICDRGASEWCISSSALGSALRARRRRPIFIIDAALPGDVEDRVEELDDAFLYRLEDLERLSLEGKASGAAALVQARDILLTESGRYLAAFDATAAEAPMEELRAHFEAIRQEVLAEEPDDAEAATGKFMQRLLRAPREAFQKDRHLTTMFRRLFGLNNRAQNGEEDR